MLVVPSLVNVPVKPLVLPSCVTFSSMGVKISTLIFRSLPFCNKSANSESAKSTQCSPLEPFIVVLQ